jgi:hypothetical protein
MKTNQCKKCGRLIKKTGEHTCADSVWNKGKKGLQVSANKGKKFSKETKDKISQSRIKGIKDGTIKFDNKGKKHPLYGKTPWNKNNGLLNNQIRHLFEYREWRSDVFSRDNFTCQTCFEKGIYLHAHHIFRFIDIMVKYKIDSLEKARNCSELWNINNGRTLCINCHNKEHKHLIK